MFEYLGIRPKAHVGMAIAKTGATVPLFKPLILEFFGAAKAKRVIDTGGGSIFV